MLQKVLKAARFSAVGATNALFHLSILNIIFNITKAKIFSGIVASCSAMTLSFFLNRRFVFKAEKQKKQIPKFIISTVFSMLIVFNLTYIALIFLIDKSEEFSKIQPNLQISSATVVAALVAALSNFVLYNSFVFKSQIDKSSDGQDDQNC